MITRFSLRLQPLPLSIYSYIGFFTGKTGQGVYQFTTSKPPENKYRIIVISGSLRKKSTNSGLLRALVEAGHPNLQFQWASIIDIPMFNEDIEAKEIPASVQRVKEQIAKSQGLLFGVTQNNYALSAALKNTYDWLSRSPLLKDYAAAMVSVAGGSRGLNAQKQLREITKFFSMKIMETPQLAFNRFADPTLFDENGNLVKQEVKDKLKPYNEALAAWIHENLQKKKTESAKKP